MVRNLESWIKKNMYIESYVMYGLVILWRNLVIYMNLGWMVIIGFILFKILDKLR